MITPRNNAALVLLANTPEMEYGERVLAFCHRTQHFDALLACAEMPGKDKAERAAVATPAALAVAAWLKADDVPTCVLEGLPGVGKTVAALRWCWVTGAEWMSVPELTTLGWQRLDERLSTNAKKPRVALDEIGLATASPPLRRKLLAWLLARHDSGLLTLCTSNANQRQVSDWLGDDAGRWAARVDASKHWHVCKGHVLRGTEHKERAHIREYAMACRALAVAFAGSKVRGYTDRIAADTLAAARKIRQLDSLTTDETITSKEEEIKQVRSEVAGMLKAFGADLECEIEETGDC